MWLFYIGVWNQFLLLISFFFHSPIQVGPNRCRGGVSTVHLRWQGTVRPKQSLRFAGWSLFSCWSKAVNFTVRNAIVDSSDSKKFPPCRSWPVHAPEEQQVDYMVKLLLRKGREKKHMHLSKTNVLAAESIMVHLLSNGLRFILARSV